MPIKLSDLTAVASALAALDLVIMVDVSDTTQAASGSTRKVPLQTFLQAFALIGTPMADVLDADLLPYYDPNAPTVPKSVALAELRNIVAGAAGALTTASGPTRLRYGARTKGRPRLAGRNSSGREVLYQHADASVYRAFIGPSLTTTLQTFGCTVTSVGTISHPAPTQVAGHMSNHVTAGTANATAGTGDATAKFFRGDGSGPAAGFDFAARLYLPDASYDQSGATTGSRLFAGLTSGTLAAAVASDNPAGDIIGFARNHSDAGLQHTNWQVVTKDGSTINFLDTTLPFTAQHVYDCFIWCSNAGGTAYWTIEDVTSGQMASGSIATSLPTATVAMRFGMQVQSVNAVARNIREQHLICEADV